MIEWILGFVLFFIVIFLLSGIRIVRPTERAVVETLGKYSGYRMPGFNFIIPIFQRMIKVNITEQLVDVEPQEIITKDNLNAEVDLMVYYKVKPDEKNLVNALYNVNEFDTQIVSLAQTTARNVIGDMDFKQVNNQRDALNANLQKILVKQTTNWGIDIVRVEMKEIRPPKDVQETMNKIIKAANEKTAAIDFASARETEADGIKRASIKEAEGKKQAAILEAQGLKEGRILVAQGEAERIKLVNESAKKHFTGNAVALRKLDVTESALRDNAKIILSEKGINPQLLIGDLPISSKKS